jgi:hypothetical protein
MEYLKPGTHVLIRNSSIFIANELKEAYLATLCMELQSDHPPKSFDVNLSRRQLEMLRDSLVYQLNTHLLLEMYLLMRVAANKADAWHNNKGTLQLTYTYAIYRDNCFHEVWKPFLDLANQIKTLDSVSYEDPKTTYEARMKACLVAHNYCSE